MAPANGSDSERLMAQIEAFLRSGEAPPAAPEPQPTRRGPMPPTRLFVPEEPDPLDSTSIWARRRELRHRIERVWHAERVWAGRSRSPRRLGSGGRPAGGAIPPLGLDRRRVGSFRQRVSAWADKGVVEEAWRRADRQAARRAGGAPTGPAWTPVRSVIVAVGLALLLMLPYALSRPSAANPDGPDVASAAPAGPGYAFLRVNPSGTPVRWNPCQPVYYQLDLAGAPSWAQNDIAHALEQVSVVTGIQFVYSGPTNQFPNGVIPLGTGTAPSPVVIAWASAAESRAQHLPLTLSEAQGAFPGPTDALGRAVPILAKDALTGRMVYVSGSLVLSAAAAALPAGFVPGGDGVLLLHEMGRLMGLGEVSDTAQVMSPQALSSGSIGFAAGDRAGLSRLGRSSGCLALPAHASLFTAF